MRESELSLLEQFKIFCNGCDYVKKDGICSNLVLPADGKPPETQMERVLDRSCRWAAVKGQPGEMTIEGFIPSQGC